MKHWLFSLFLGLLFLCMGLWFNYLAPFPIYLGFLFSRRPLGQAFSLALIFYYGYSLFSLSSFWVLGVFPVLFLVLLKLIEGNLSLSPSLRDGVYMFFSLAIFRVTWALPLWLVGQMPENLYSYLFWDGLLLAFSLWVVPGVRRFFKYKLRERRQRRTYWALR